MRSRVAGIVPAAGRSSRMGRSKALLAPGGRTFLGRLTHALVQGGCDPVLVVVRDGASPEADAAHALGLQPVINPDPSEGPVSSLRAGLAALPTDVGACVWCPVDYPLVRADTVAALLASSAEAPDCVVIPAHAGRRGHPVVFPRELFARLAEPGLADGARTVVREHPRRVTVAVDDPGILTDIDTPEDYREVFGEAPAALSVPTTGAPVDEPGDR
jgi:molybdenum cofactor cytidylyltransferase